MSPGERRELVDCRKKRTPDRGTKPPSPGGSFSRKWSFRTKLRHSGVGAGLVGMAVFPPHSLTCFYSAMLA